MCKILCLFVLLFLINGSLPAKDESPNTKISNSKVIIVPIEGAISSPQLYILRRAIREAETQQIDAILLEMNTPGGALNTTLEIMEVLDNFNGTTLTFINNEAISAGAYISVATDEIYFSPKGVMGAAAVIQGTGQEIPETAKMKIDSYLMAKVRTLTANYPYRTEVVRAMMDKEYELIIDDAILKKKGELLTLTADEAINAYGNPPRPLLSSGTFENVDQLLDHKFGENQYSVVTFEVSWSEHLAKFMSNISPILMGLGMLLLFVEFKTPGFGVFGITGIILLAIVFAGKFVAGLAGNETLLIFSLGAILLIVEFFIFPGTFISGILGFMCIFGALGWSLVDKWPSNADPLQSYDFSSAIITMSQSLLIAVIGFILVARFMPKSMKNRLVLNTVVGNKSHDIHKESKINGSLSLLIGETGEVVHDLHPYGTIRLKSGDFTAKSSLGEIEKGSGITVTGVSGSDLIVAKK